MKRIVVLASHELARNSAYPVGTVPVVVPAPPARLRALQIHCPLARIALHLAALAGICMLMLLALATCGQTATAQRNHSDRPVGIAPDAMAVLEFTLFPDADSTNGGVDRVRRVTVWFSATLPIGEQLYGYYTVHVIGLAPGLLIHTPATQAIDAQLRDLRTQAEDAARELVRRSRLSCDSLRSRKPANTFGYVCA